MGLAAGQIALDTDLSGLVAKTYQKPIGRLVADTTQALADNTAVAVVWNTEEFDTHGFHSTSVNVTRITPTIPGYYRINSDGMFGARADYNNMNLWVRTNGANNNASADRMTYGGTVTSGIQTLHANVILPFNGTTDYAEIIMQADNAANVAGITNRSGQFACSVHWEFVRDL